MDAPNSVRLALALLHLYRCEGVMRRSRRWWSDMHPPNPLSVLVVDDERDHRQALAKVFERAGYCVCTACDGQEALTIVAERPFQLIITDLCMPRLNGVQFLRHVRAMSPQAAVIAITAYGELSTYVEAMDCGCVDYLSKPVRRLGLLLTARKALARRGIRAPEDLTPAC